jgi:nucleoside-diphosphate-sugar epimerase
MADERFLVTGALGCIGAWTCAVLAEEGVDVVGYDLGSNTTRLALAGAADVPLVRASITDRQALDAALDAHSITHVIHLAALQIPLVKADPANGAGVNIVGTVHVFEAARERGVQVAFASSAAVHSAAHDGHPTTFYGVHKRACEGLARIYWQDEGVPSIGLRPFVVYGPGRDTGLTAAPTLAMAAAARGEDSVIAFGGRAQLQFAPDTARIFVAAARAAVDGAHVHHLGGPAVTLAETAAAIEAATGTTVTVDETVLLPFPEEFDGSSLEQGLGEIRWTPLEQGVAETIERLRAAQA